MIAALFYGPGDVRMGELPVPKVGPGDVLIKVRAALTCGTDVKTWVRGHTLFSNPPEPFGHECAGEIVEMGEEVRGWSIGDRVVAHNSASCGCCYYCKMGAPSMCEDILWSMGAFAEYVRVPARIVQQNMFKMPDDMEFKYAALVEPLSCAVFGVAETPIKLGDICVVQGAGPIGLMITALAAKRGAHVIQVDLSDDRLEIARKMGAAETINPKYHDDPVKAIRALTPGSRGADVVIEATGFPEVWEQAMQLARKGGEITWFGGCKKGTEVKVDTHPFHYSQLTARGLFHTTSRYVQTAFDLIARRAIPLEPMVTMEMPLSQVLEALELHRTQKVVKVALIP